MKPKSLSKVQQFDLIQLIWRDAYFDFEQKHAEDKRDDYLVKTCGFFLGADEDFIHLAGEILPDSDGFRAVTHIPIEMIEEVAVCTGGLL